MTSNGEALYEPIAGTSGEKFGEGFGNGYMQSYKNASTFNFSDLMDAVKSAVQGISFLKAISDDEYSKTHEKIFGNGSNPDESPFSGGGNVTRDKFSSGIKGMNAYDWGYFTGQTAFETLTSYAAGKASNPYPKIGKSTGTLTLADELPMTAPKTTPNLRAAYEAEVQGLSKLAEEMKIAGSSPEDIARKLHGTRRELGIKYKSLTPDALLQEIYQRNIQKYGDKLGPSIEWLRNNNKSWEDIIKSSSRSGGKDLNFNK